MFLRRAGSLWLRSGEGAAPTAFGGASNAIPHTEGGGGDKYVRSRMYLNKVILMGTVGRDPYVYQTQGEDGAEEAGKASFSLASVEYYKDKENNWASKTTWHNIAVYDKHFADVTKRLIRKGAQVYIEGQIHTKKFLDKRTNQERTTTEITVAKYKGNIRVILPGREDGEPDTTTNPEPTLPNEFVD